MGRYRVQVIDNDLVVAFDVDETLVMWEGTGYRVNYTHVTSLKHHFLRGHFVIIWSAGGVKWAQRVVKELELEPFVNLVMSKKRWYYDDMPADKWMTRVYKEEKL